MERAAQARGTAPRIGWAADPRPRGWRCADGQIDIVAAEHQTLVVCEIQTHSASGPLSPPMSRAKRSRFRRLAARWLVAHGLLFDEVRVDVVRLIHSRSGALSIEHQREPD